MALGHSSPDNYLRCLEAPCGILLFFPFAMVSCKTTGRKVVDPDHLLDLSDLCQFFFVMYVSTIRHGMVNLAELL